MTFERFYGSALHQPLLLWCAAAFGVALVATDRGAHPSVRRFALAWSVVPFLGAWLTGDEVPGIGALPAGVGTAVATFFVIVGDLRVFLFLEGTTAEGMVTLGARAWGRAIGWSLAVPIASTLVRAALPDAPWRGRAVFLVYEVLFTAVMLGWLAFGRARFAWGRRVIGVVIAYYALWAVADAVILAAGADGAYLLRVVANVLYYGGLLAFVSRSAPRPDAADHTPKGARASA